MIYTKIYDVPSVNKREILRYAGMRGDAPELEAVLDECLHEAAGKLEYKVCFDEIPIKIGDGELDLAFGRTPSVSLVKNLDGCDSMILFAATVGLGIDRLIARYLVTSPVRALFFDAIGSERIESLCDTFERDILKQVSQEGKALRPRFSAGYGDLPLSLQKDIFAYLDCPRKIGLTVSESLLMTPTKSVTAIIGITRGN